MRQDRGLGREKHCAVVHNIVVYCCLFFFQAEDGIRDYKVTGVQTCALPISPHGPTYASWHSDLNDEKAYAEIIVQEKVDPRMRVRPNPAEVERAAKLLVEAKIDRKSVV